MIILYNNNFICKKGNFVKTLFFKKKEYSLKN